MQPISSSRHQKNRLLWHVPTYWLGQGIHNVPAIWMVFFLLPWTILFNWAYNKSNGSILVSIFFHATMGATLSYTPFCRVNVLFRCLRI